MTFPSYDKRCIFGELLKDHRTRHGWSMHQFAREVNHSHTFISRVELGKRCPPMSEMESWAKHLELNASERTAFLAEAALAHVPEGYLLAARTYLIEEGVRLEQKRVRPPDPEPAPSTPPDHDSEIVIDA